MKKKINTCGYDYVDLELPSGTLWATCNVGAKKPSDYGWYFQWGDISGYTKDQIGIDKYKKAFTFEDYKWKTSGDAINFGKYDTVNATLDLEDDAAHANMGGNWHMPSSMQIQELLDNTTTAWTKLDDVSGMEFTSKKDASKSIFIPAAGDAWVDSIDDCGEGGCIWSSMLSTECIGNGQVLGFFPQKAYIEDYCIYIGYSIRGVIG